MPQLSGCVGQHKLAKMKLESEMQSTSNKSYYRGKVIGKVTRGNEKRVSLLTGEETVLIF